jgi:hypothetical protein
MPPAPPRSTTPTTVSTAPGSRSRHRIRAARASRNMAMIESSVPVRIHRRIRPVRASPVNGRPDLPAEPADWRHTTRFRRCGRSPIAASCNPGSALRVLQWYAPAFSGRGHQVRA